MTLWKRILVEKRSLVIPLALALVINIAIYVLVVHPLGVKSASAADRAANANLALQSAEREYEGAKALVSGKSRAEQELSTFYDKVLPADLVAARRLTYASLPRLAKKTNVKYEQGRYEPEPLKSDTRLGHLHIRMVLQGEYESLRQFIYELESAPEFIILDDFALAQSDPARPPLLTVELSTYYRLGANGT